MMIRAAHFLKAWLKDQKGTAAIEFGLIAPIFLALVCGIMFLGVFLFNSNRLDSAAFEASRQVMLVNEPTLDNLEAEVNGYFTDLNLEGTTYRVTIGQRPDGGDEAIITASYTMTNPTAFLNTKGFTHDVEYRVPLWEN